MIRGHIKATVIKKDGTKFVHYDGDNQIQTVWLNYLAGLLQNDTDYSLDTLFSDYGAITIGQDGIMVIDDASAYKLKCTGAAEYGYTPGWSEPTSKSCKLTGIFTGTGITIEDKDSVMLGYYAVDAPGFSILIAKPDSWSSLALNSSDVLVIEWTITYQDA